MFIPVLCYLFPICIHLFFFEVRLPAGTVGVDVHPRDPWPPEYICTSLDNAFHAI